MESQSLAWKHVARSGRRFHICSGSGSSYGARRTRTGRLGGVPDGIEDQDRDGQVDPWETDPTLIGDDQFAFYVNNLIPGERVQFEAYSSRSVSLIVPLYSISGSGPTALGIGVTVDLSLPIRVLNPAYTDSAGRASIRGPVVPQAAPIGLQVWLQAIEIPFAPGEAERVSNLVSLPVGSR